MRLDVTSNGHAFLNRAFLAFARWNSGEEPVDVLKVIHYRSDFWGRPYSDLLQDVMRGPSEWEVGERELFAAFTAKLARCVF